MSMCKVGHLTSAAIQIQLVHFINIVYGPRPIFYEILKKVVGEII